MANPPEVVVISSSDSSPRPSRPPQKRRRLQPPPRPSTPSSSSDLELVSHVMRNGPTSDLSTPKPPTKPPTTSNDAEIAEVGSRTLLQALVDYPHFRFQCITEPFKRQRAWKKERHCPRCFCYVCDVPARDCPRWKAHSKAVDSAHKWRVEREANLEARRQRHAAQPAARRTTPARHVRPMPVRNPLPDEMSLGSDVEYVPLDPAPVLVERPHSPFEDARRALEQFELQPDLFAMRSIVVALDDAAGAARVVPTGAAMRSSSRRAVTRRAGAS